MIDALPEWVTMAVGAVACLALPLVVGWMIWGTVRTGRGVAQSLAGGPGDACRELGLSFDGAKRRRISVGVWGLAPTGEKSPQAVYRQTLRLGERGALSGIAEGTFAGRAVRVTWAVGHEHGYDPSHHVTRAAAAVTPPLGVGLEGSEGSAAEGIGWPQLEQRLGVRAADPARAREALGRAGPTLWSSLGGPGRLLLDDASVTVELPGVSHDRAAIEAALRRAATLAAALST